MVQYPDGVKLHSLAAIHLNDESVVQDKGQFLIHKFNSFVRLINYKKEFVCVLTSHDFMINLCYETCYM